MAERLDFVAKVIGPVSRAEESQTTVLLAGDFNFVSNPDLDSSAGEEGRVADRPIAAAFAAHCPPDLIDTFRAEHPARRAYSHMYTAPTAGGSRLDRIYVSRDGAPYVAGASIPMATPSDHRMAITTLMARTGLDRGPGLKRIRCDFTAFQDLNETFLTWLRTELGSRPGEGEQGELVEWWGPFKKRMVRMARDLSRAARGRRCRPGERVRAALEEAARRQDLADRGDLQAGSMSELVAAQTEVVSAMQEEGARCAKSVRVQWLRTGERPSRALTNLIRPPQSQNSVAGLRDASGQLVTNMAKLPQLVAEFWGGICQTPPILEPGARTEVLEALKAQGIRMNEEAAQAVGDAKVTAAEVLQVLKGLKPGKSPGGDGIPGELYKSFREEFAPVMVDLYTAMMAVERTPEGFVEGVITTLYKNRGPRHCPGSYRPITLLNTDYRVLAKALANRLGPALGKVVTLEQSAFLPNRLIGANVLFLRQLPHLMARQGRSCVLAFLDIAKAYDTIDRDFLAEAMQAMGAGAGLIGWVQLLLSNTASRAVVNGFPSGLVPIKAGVRQGCPLAPLLYLFVAQALLCWLQHCGVGIRLREQDRDLTTAVQFADDTEVVLGSMAAVGPFLECMHTYAQATGQQLNLDKVELLRVGAAAGRQEEGVAENAHNLREVRMATALNLPFTDASQAPEMNWEQQSEKVRERYTRIAKLPLSAFGRATAAAAYGVHRLTWHMEHGGLPPEAAIDRLDGWTAKLIDRGQEPGAVERRATGIPRSLLPGHPTVGGFGALPLREHVRARWAAAAVRYIGRGESTARAPWQKVMDALLAEISPGWNPRMLLTARRDSPWRGGQNLPVDTARIVTALAYMPPLVDVAEDPLIPGTWCWNAPLWGNPLLPPDRQEGARAGLEHEHPDLMDCRQLRTLGNLVRARAEIRRVTAGWAASPVELTDRAARRANRDWRAFVIECLDPEEAAARWGDWRRWEECGQELGDLERKVPACWMAAARAGGSPSEPVGNLPSEEQVSTMLVARLGWRICEGVSVAIGEYSVRLGSALQQDHFRQRREEAHRLFVAEAVGQATDSPWVAEELRRLTETLPRLWQETKWENTHKEAYWRLAVDGVPLLGNSHMRRAGAAKCGCGVRPGHGESRDTPRKHHFWACPVAQAVVGQVEPKLGVAITRANLWLVQAPGQTEQCVWDVIVMAAISAMETGRRFMAATMRRGAGQGEPRLEAGTDLAERGARRAVIDFWGRLHGFTQLGVPKRGWASVGRHHPVLRVTESGLRCSGPSFEE